MMAGGSRKSRLLIPESYDAMTRFKMEVAEEIGHLQWVKENNDHYKGNVPAKINGNSDRIIKIGSRADFYYSITTLAFTLNKSIVEFNKLDRVQVT
ncbi:MAG: small acid-soluble spore protein [Clostridiales bacterium]|nr:small acid-soluble spore protein [Clostridiales bacterium]